MRKVSITYSESPNCNKVQIQAVMMMMIGLCRDHILVSAVKQHASFHGLHSLQSSCAPRFYMDLVYVLHGNVLFCEFALALVWSCCTLLPSQDAIPILVNLELGDHNLAGVNSEVYCAS